MHVCVLWVWCPHGILLVVRECQHNACVSLTQRRHLLWNMVLGVAVCRSCIAGRASYRLFASCGWLSGKIIWGGGNWTGMLCLWQRSQGWTRLRCSEIAVLFTFRFILSSLFPGYWCGRACLPRSQNPSRHRKTFLLSSLYLSCHWQHWEQFSNIKLTSKLATPGAYRLWSFLQRVCLCPQRTERRRGIWLT